MKVKMLMCDMCETLVDVNDDRSDEYITVGMNDNNDWVDFCCVECALEFFEIAMEAELEALDEV